VEPALAGAKIGEREALAVVDAKGRMLYETDGHRRVLADGDGASWTPASPPERYEKLASKPGTRERFTRERDGGVESYEAVSIAVRGGARRTDRHAVIVLKSVPVRSGEAVSEN
jgi:hypothetical protein